MDVLAILQPTKSTLPTGGVHSPMQRLSTMTMPKWMGFIPSWTTTGRKMGVKINTAGVISMNVPTMSRNTLMISRMTILLSVSAIRAALTFWGMFS
ncbi:hypothetical protein ES703_24712 [subsurface metagenome]